MSRAIGSVVIAAILLGSCASQHFEGGAVPTGKMAVAIANRLCPTGGLRKGPWHVQLEDGQWRLWRLEGREVITIDAATGDTFGCRTT